MILAYILTTMLILDFNEVLGNCIIVVLLNSMIVWLVAVLLVWKVILYQMFLYLFIYIVHVI